MSVSERASQAILDRTRPLWADVVSTEPDLVRCGEKAAGFQQRGPCDLAAHAPAEPSGRLGGASIANVAAGS